MAPAVQKLMVSVLTSLSLNDTGHDFHSYLQYDGRSITSSIPTTTSSHEGMWLERAPEDITVVTMFNGWNGTPTGINLNKERQGPPTITVTIDNTAPDPTPDPMVPDTITVTIDDATVRPTVTIYEHIRYPSPAKNDYTLGQVIMTPVVFIPNDRIVTLEHTAAITTTITVVVEHLTIVPSNQPVGHPATTVYDQPPPTQTMVQDTTVTDYSFYKGPAPNTLTQEEHRTLRIYSGVEFWEPGRLGEPGGAGEAEIKTMQLQYGHLVPAVTPVTKKEGAGQVYTLMPAVVGPQPILVSSVRTHHIMSHVYITTGTANLR
jgi:hypothetical protein